MKEITITSEGKFNTVTETLYQDDSIVERAEKIVNLSFPGFKIMNSEVLIRARLETTLNVIKLLEAYKELDSQK